ncbi:AraC family transcriptional regulator [Paenibacillus qinlingensis]|uniref:AraC-like DNA-binding protein n=1 Tax=Paenibacillus qinlingensis TaxID=1837343 RepID=A0ABU1NNQ1_9BACL|nr:AraC family transcriptional regulator [Paenibacillus qinlingensis]MDR6549098.1 AraC-like DNA-binding protein [Paenibacillus qinlingensis]
MKLIDNVLGKHPYLSSVRKFTTDEKGYAIFHAHQGLEFLYVEQGDGHIIIDNKLIPMHPQTLYCFQPYQLHKVNAKASSDQPYIRSLIVIEPLTVLPYLAVFPELSAFFQRVWKEILPTQFFEISEAGPIFALLQHELDNQDHGNQLEVVALTVIAILRKLREVMDEKEAAHVKRASRKIAIVEQAMAWFDTNYRESFRLNDLASELHISPYYLSHLFKKDTGSTLTEYVTVKRLREACLLLQSTEQSVEMIASQVGFATASHFIYTFKKHMGITPYQYRTQDR